jgi:uncharacterized protein (TIGR02588 family)
VKRVWLEWVVLGLSVVALVVLASGLALQALTAGSPPVPRIELLADEARETPIGWLVPAELTNDGDEAAQAVVIEATATVEGSEESSELTVDFLPAGTTVDVEFGFSAQPESAVSVRVVGLQLP